MTRRARRGRGVNTQAFSFYLVLADRVLGSIGWANGSASVAAALCAEYHLISQQAQKQMDRSCSVHTIIPEANDDRQNESREGLERLEPKVLIKTDVIVQGEKYDEIMMEVRQKTKHDVIEKSHDLSHGGFGIQFSNEDSLDSSLELEEKRTHVQFNENSTFIVEYDIDQMGNFKNIYLLAPISYVFSGNYKIA